MLKGGYVVARFFIALGLLLLVPLLRAQQVEDEVAFAYSAQPSYPYDAELGELFSAKSGSLLAQLSQQFWTQLLQQKKLIPTIAPLSKELFQFQFGDIIHPDATLWGLARIRTGQPIKEEDSGQVSSKLIFQDNTYLLVTLYLRHLPAATSSQSTADSAVEWLIEAADFDPSGRRSQRSGYDYNPRNNNFLREINR